jgi:hypothetical protein
MGSVGGSVMMVRSATATRAAVIRAKHNNSSPVIEAACFSRVPL